MEAKRLGHPQAATLVGVELEKVGDTFSNVQGTAQIENLSGIIAKVKAKTFGDLLGNIKAQAQVDLLV